LRPGAPRHILGLGAIHPIPGKAAILGLMGLELRTSEERKMSRVSPIRRALLAGMAPEPELADDRVHAFRKAQRHSRRVRLLRWALPSLALGGLAIILSFVWFDPFRFYRNLPVEFGRISITDNKLTIEAPKLTGFTQDRRPYWVTADEAAQDLGSPNRIELAGIKGQVELANRGETKIQAAKGLYDLKTGNLELNSGIEIGSTGGYKMEMNDALMQVRAGRIATDQPVKATFPEGVLSAQRLEILNHGDHVKFTGGVTVTFRVPRERTDRDSRTVEARQ
jgi:lipopolysaccharide export system protein LptC